MYYLKGQQEKEKENKFNRITLGHNDKIKIIMDGLSYREKKKKKKEKRKRRKE